MMKVYVLLDVDYDDSEIIGVYHTLELAKAAAHFQVWTEDTERREDDHWLRQWFAGGVGEAQYIEEHEVSSG